LFALLDYDIFGLNFRSEGQPRWTWWPRYSRLVRIARFNWQ